MIYYRILSKFYQRPAQKMCQDCAGFIKNGSRILDLGCGSAIIGKAFQNFFQAEVIGVDIDDKRVEKIPFKIIDGVNLPFADNSFDTVLIVYVLHHASDPVSLLKEAKRVTRNNIVIYEDVPEGFLSSFFCGFHGTIFNAFFQNKKQQHHFKKPKEWENIFQQPGLKIVYSKKFFPKYNPLYPVKRILFVVEKQ